MARRLLCILIAAASLPGCSQFISAPGGYAMAPPVSIDRTRQKEISDANFRTHTSFENRDTNSDSVVTREEYSAGKSACYWAFDLDNDGRLTWPEFAMASCQIPANGVISPRNKLYASCLRGELTTLRWLDANHDGSIDAKEIQRFGVIGFKERDHCRNGRLTPEEWGHPESNFRPSSWP